VLVLHAAIVGWDVAANSVTFDENFHLPAGVAIVTRGDFHASVAQPPLVKALCALPALAAGARAPADGALKSRDEAVIGESFMRRNVDRYQRVYVAARLVVVLFSLGLGLLVWRFARRLYGPQGGLLALALEALAPETLAHAGLVGLDLPTALGFTASIYAFYRFARTGRWRDWGWLALAVGATFLTRFSAAQLAPILFVLAAWGTLVRRIRRTRRVWLGLALLAPVTLVALQLGYAFQTSFVPLRQWTFESPSFHSLAARWPGLRLPLPDDYVRGLDYLSFLSQPGQRPTYLLGQVRWDRVWLYFPLALLFKWPVGFLLALATRAIQWRARPRRRLWEEGVLLVPVVIVFGSAVAANLNSGIRYVYPILPLLAVWMGGLAAIRAGRAVRRWAAIGAIAAAIQTSESALASPWHLSFFNVFAGGPGGGYRLVNDSNVDWGQGLLALRDDMRRFHIARIHLCYHGTTDPSVYGIDYLPYQGGAAGPESDWIAISKYYFVGLSQRMMTRQGRTPVIGVRFDSMRDMQPSATPGNSMLLYRLR